jgi:F0F1-type ATP synthase assembly protein I
MAVGVLIGLLLGHVIDDRIGSEFPVFTIGGALVGLASGVVSLARVVRYLSSPRKE